MINNQTIIIPLEGDFAHSADFLRQTALTLAANNNQVYIYDQDHSYFWLKKKPLSKFLRYDRICFYQPKYLIPGRRWPFIERINRLLSWWLFVKSFGHKAKILWFFYPNHHDLAQIKCKNCRKIYDCVDYQEDKNQETKLINNVDYFFVNSETLFDLHRQQNKKPILLHAQGFFVPDKNIVSTNRHRFKKPVIGFAGGINYRLDFKLLEQIVSRNPQWQFIFYGPRQKNETMDKKFNTEKWLDRLKSFSNVWFGSSEDRNLAYKIIDDFEIAIIPYNTTIDFNKYCYPMKLFEYLYFGKPILSTKIKELEKLRFKNLVFSSDNSDFWQKKINNILNNKNNNADKCRSIAMKNSWVKKTNEIINNIY